MVLSANTVVAGSALGKQAVADALARQVTAELSLAPGRLPSMPDGVTYDVAPAEGSDELNLHRAPVADDRRMHRHEG